MTTAAIILAVLVILALMRFGVSAEYGEDGFLLTARAGFIKIRVFPRKEKPKKVRKPAKTAEKAQKKPEKKKKPGRLKPLQDMLPSIKTALSRLRRRILIKNLVIYYTAAGTDPVKTAMSFGGASAVFGTVTAGLERSFRIKRRDLRAFADFETDEPGIYVNAAISLAVWEAVYILIAIVPAFVGGKKSTSGKDEVQNGRKTPDKRADGNDNAKSQGDGRR